MDGLTTPTDRMIMPLSDVKIRFGLMFESTMTTTSSFTNPAILRLQLSYSNLLPILFRLRNESRSDCLLRGGVKHEVRADAALVWKADLLHQVIVQK